MLQALILRVAPMGRSDLDRHGAKDLVRCHESNSELRSRFLKAKQCGKTLRLAKSGYFPGARSGHIRYLRMANKCGIFGIREW
jgi:hypothetical protein